MSTPNNDDAEAARVRALNARLARNYDQVVYEPAFSSVIDPERAFGLADLYGCAPAAGTDIDVLDIGCGTGSILHHVGRQTRGRLVGVDISPEACALARQHCAPDGMRASILCADFLDLEAETLGQFDLIYCIGVMGLTPPVVRRKILGLIGQCLRPGGLLVVSYYVGGLPALMAPVAKLVRAAVDPGLAPDARIAAARGALDQIGAQATTTEPFAGAIGEVVAVMRGMGEANLFHEVLTELAPQANTDLADALAPAGIVYLGYLNKPCPRNPASRQRAVSADLADLAGGGYRYTLYARPRGNAAPIPLRKARTSWSTGLQPPSGPLAFGRPITFSQAGLGSLDLHHPLVQAAFVRLGSGGPLTFAEMRDEGLAVLAAAGVAPPPDGEEVLERDLEVLWTYGFATPVLNLG